MFFLMDFLANDDSLPKLSTGEKKKERERERANGQGLMKFVCMCVWKGQGGVCNVLLMSVIIPHSGNAKLVCLRERERRAQVCLRQKWKLITRHSY